MQGLHIDPTALVVEWHAFFLRCVAWLCFVLYCMKPKWKSEQSKWQQQQGESLFRSFDFCYSFISLFITCLLPSLWKWIHCRSQNQERNWLYYKSFEMRSIGKVHTHGPFARSVLPPFQLQWAGVCRILALFFFFVCVRGESNWWYKWFIISTRKSVVDCWYVLKCHCKCYCIHTPIRSHHMNSQQTSIKSPVHPSILTVHRFANGSFSWWWNVCVRHVHTKHLWPCWTKLP